MNPINWMRNRLPWAAKKHYHGDPTLLKYGVCARCGHVILNRHVSNSTVSIHAWGVTWGATYAKACAPMFTHLELAPDRTVHAYMTGESGKLEIPKTDMDTQSLEELDRLTKEMLKQVAHHKNVVNTNDQIKWPGSSPE